MRKLYQIAVWLRNGTFHSDNWDDGVQLRLGINNATRWNSWWAMINRALRKKDPVEAFLNEYRSDLGLDNNVLDDSDWSYLERTHTSSAW